MAFMSSVHQRRPALQYSICWCRELEKAMFVDCNLGSYRPYAHAAFPNLGRTKIPALTDCALTNICTKDWGRVDA